MSFAEAEQARVRAHLLGALAALRDAPTDHLDDTRRARRAALAAHLAAYIAAGRFPRNTTGLPFTPVFVDDLGTRCAVAALLDATGGAALVHAVADTDNLARVHTLAALPALRDWLDAQGLTVDEAAGIQPAYQARDVVDWRPAVAVVTEAAFGRSEGTGAHLALGVGARVGVRRRVHSQSVSGTVHYGAAALLAEYTRTVTVGDGAAHQLALLAQWEPAGGTSDAQWYLLAGPAAVLDPDTVPGGAVGGRAGVGFSLRGRTLPWMGEAGLTGLAQGGGLTLRVGVTLGVGW